MTIGDDGDDALTPLISSSPSSPPTESATVATIATVTLPPPILPSQPSQPEAKSFALARFQNRWYNEAVKKTEQSKSSKSTQLDSRVLFSRPCEEAKNV